MTQVSFLKGVFTFLLTFTLFVLYVNVAGAESAPDNEFSANSMKYLSAGIAIAIGLILGGAIGNIIDSCFYGIIFIYPPLDLS